MESADDLARTAFEAGIEAAKAEDFARARSLFLRSRELVPKPSTLLNLALVDLKLGLADEATAVVDELLASAEGPGYERLRQRALQLREEAAALHDSQVGGALPHPPVVMAPPAPPEPPAPSPGVAAPTHSELPAAPPPAPRLAGPRALIATAAVLAASSAVTGFLWWRERSQAVDACTRADGVTCEQPYEIARQRNAAVGVTVALDVAALALAVGGVSWLVKRRNERPMSVALLPRATGLGLRVQY